MTTLLRDEYELLGALGRPTDGAAVWLARERTTGELVALRLDHAGSDPAGSDAAVLRQLGPGVPFAPRSCPHCRDSITDWRRFCQHCGADVAGDADANGAVPAADMSLLLEDVGRQNLDLLGTMARAEGGSAVFFAQNRGTREIVALTIQPGTGPGAAARSVHTSAFNAADLAAPPAPTAAAAPAPAASTGDAPEAVAAADEARICPACSRSFGPDVRFCSHDGSVLRSAAVRDDLIGQILAERYHVIESIGRGGMGQVYLAEHVRMGRRCAVKVLHRAMSQDPTAVSRFAREAAHASRITHPNVATIFDFGETSDRLIYLAMEYVEGESLSALLERERTLAPARSIAFAMEIADALAAAHREGVVHRDLKPDNILIGRRGEREFVKVVDFGIAKAMDAASNGLTQTGFVVGTPRYMSPEQLIAAEVDGRTDIYSLGLVLFEMLVGASPVDDEQGGLRLTARLTEPPPSPRGRNPGISPQLDAVVRRALGRTAAERYQTADELRQALLSCAGDAASAVAGTAIGSGALTPHAASRAAQPPAADPPQAVHLPTPPANTASASTASVNTAPTPAPGAEPAPIPAAATLASTPAAGAAAAIPDPPQVRPAASYATARSSPGDSSAAASRVPAAPAPKGGRTAPAARRELLPDEPAAPAAPRTAIRLYGPKVALTLVVLLFSGAALWLLPVDGTDEDAAPIPAPAAPTAGVAGSAGEAGAGESAPVPYAGNGEPSPQPSAPATSGAVSGAAAAAPADGPPPENAQQVTTPAGRAPAPGGAAPRAAGDAAVRGAATQPTGTPAAAAEPAAAQPAPPAAQPAPSFDSFAAAEVRRFGAALETRDMGRVRAVFSVGGLSADFERELGQVLQGLTAPRVHIDPIEASGDALRLVFRLQITDGPAGETAFSALLNATFAPAGNGWLLILVARR